MKFLRLRTKVNEVLSSHTGKSLDTIKEDTDRDFFMSATEAKDYGLLDEVLVNTKEKNSKK